MPLQAIHAWATVHRGGMHHLSHTHPDHMVSGVYYVSVPPQAGGIIFSDPRGRFPPFDETLTITPKAASVGGVGCWVLVVVPAFQQDGTMVRQRRYEPGAIDPQCSSACGAVEVLGLRARGGHRGNGMVLVCFGMVWRN